MGGIQEEEFMEDEGQVEEDDITDDGRRGEGVEYDGLGDLRGQPAMALRSILGRWRTAWWRNRSASGMRVDPMNVSRWKHRRRDTPMV